MPYNMFAEQYNVQLTCTAVSKVREMVAVFAVSFLKHYELFLPAVLESAYMYF